MSKLIRFDEDHFGYLVDRGFDTADARRFADLFREGYPGKRLLVIPAEEFIDLTEEFIDLTGQYEIVPIPAGSPPEVDR